MGTNLKRIQNLLKEQKEVFEEIQDAPLSKEDKKAFLEAVRSYSRLGEMIYSRGDIKEMCGRVHEMVKTAGRVVTEDQDWFDSVSLRQETKRLQDDYKIFEKSAQEMAILQERLTMSYENIGSGLKKFFDMD